ncbi:MAG: hypothetical protein EXR65_01920 [Dehalococcoidia bacterium]|nr:hypothetical protein [Dehalococcoidia bacterium]
MATKIAKTASCRASRNTDQDDESRLAVAKAEDVAREVAAPEGAQRPGMPSYPAVAGNQASSGCDDEPVTMTQVATEARMTGGGTITVGSGRSQERHT